MAEVFFEKDRYPAVPLGGGSYSRRLLASGGALLLGEMDFQTGAATPVHSHDEEQLTHCISGEFEAQVAGEIQRLLPGDSFYAGRGEPHGARCLAAGRLLHVFTPQREEYRK
jgi:quercetin dioxygenase-like cupin family protein